MTHLTLVPHGGLCNRLRTLLSARYLSEYLPEGFIRVEWVANNECGASFDNLFLPESVQTDNFQIAQRHWYNTPDSRTNLHLPGLLRRFYFEVQWVNFHSELPVETLASSLLPYERLYISTGSSLCITPAHFLQSLRLVPSLQQRIDRLSCGFNSHTIGIHIRRTDNRESITHSSDTLFRQAIVQSITTDPQANFFLATDDAQLKKQLLQEFSPRISAQTCHGTRANLMGIEEAIIDLYCLSRTHHLLGSYWSSFTDTAAELGNIPLTILTTHLQSENSTLPSPIPSYKQLKGFSSRCFSL